MTVSGCAPLTRLHITITAKRPLHWPHFAGSTLRGAFGRALRQAACLTGQSQCGGCPVRDHCAYGVVFDPAKPAQPVHPSFTDGLPRYVLQPPDLGTRNLQPGNTLPLSLLLLPGSHSHHSLLQHVLRSAIEQQLMHPGSFALHSVHTEVLPAPDIASSSVPSTAFSLTWHTPLRLQTQGKPIFKPQALDAPTLARALRRRYLQWCQLSGQPPNDGTAALHAASTCELRTHAMQWHHLVRHSSTQQQHVPLGGLLGSATLHGPHEALRALAPLLALGCLLHIGKDTVMGLGRFQLSGIEPG